MKQVLIIGNTGAIGGALAAAYQGDGWQVTGLSRRNDGLDLAAPDTVSAAIAPLEGPFDHVIVATGALEIAARGPEKSLMQVSAEGLSAQFALNAAGPVLVLAEVLAKMPRVRPSVFAVLSARVGSIGDNRLGGWYSYRAAKAALNQLIHTAAIEVARSHPRAVVACLHPGTVESALTRRYLARHPAVTPVEAAANLRRVIEGLAPDDSGGFFDWQGHKVPW